jgi:hypothetical protein
MKQICNTLNELYINLVYAKDFCPRKIEERKVLINEHIATCPICKKYNQHYKEAI